VGRRACRFWQPRSACSTQLGRASARRAAPSAWTRSTACDAGATASVAGSAELGSNRRATSTRLGRASARSASGACAAACRAGRAATTTTTTGRRSVTARADLGVASRRGSAARGACRRHLGACRGRAASAFVGRRAAGCSSARSARDRLGNWNASREHSAREPAGALVE
jgi:hypothetical protein